MSSLPDEKYIRALEQEIAELRNLVERMRLDIVEARR